MFFGSPVGVEVVHEQRGGRVHCPDEELLIRLVHHDESRPVILGLRINRFLRLPDLRGGSQRQAGRAQKQQ